MTDRLSNEFLHAALAEHRRLVDPNVSNQLAGSLEQALGVLEFCAQVDMVLVCHGVTERELRMAQTLVEGGGDPATRDELRDLLAGLEDKVAVVETLADGTRRLEAASESFKASVILPLAWLLQIPSKNSIRKPEVFGIRYHIEGAVANPGHVDKTLGLVRLRFVVSIITCSAFITIFVMMWTLVFRSGLACRVSSTELVTRVGRRAGRLRCTTRVLVVYLLPGGLLVASFLMLYPLLAWLSFLAGSAAALLMVLPTNRGIPDRIVGTWLVPK